MYLLDSTAFDHYAVISPQIFPFKKVILALDLVITRVGDNNAWFNSHSGFSGCRILRFENHALVPFSIHLEPQGSGRSVIFSIMRFGLF